MSNPIPYDLVHAVPWIWMFAQSVFTKISILCRHLNPSPQTSIEICAKPGSAISTGENLKVVWAEFSTLS
jgi:hypothetical protein